MVILLLFLRLDMLDKLQKQGCCTAGHTMAASLELFTYCRSISGLNLFCWYYFGMCLSEPVELDLLPTLMRGPSIILIGCMIFFVTICTYYKNSILIVCFILQLNSKILCMLKLF